MANLPLLLSLVDELDNEISPYPFGHDFGLGISPHHIHRQSRRQPLRNMVTYPVPLGLLSHLGERQLGRHGDKKESRISPIGKDGFQVCMDVAQFKPSELTVKVVDNSVVIEGKHEEREDQHGFIQRHFVRRYVLPKDYDSDKVVSTLSSDGVLTVSVPKPKLEAKSSERIVHIQQTGPAHLNVKQNTEEKVSDGDKGNGDEKKEEK